METKNSIRREILTLRNTMSVNERILYSHLIKDRLLAMDEVRIAKTILCFAGYGSEVNTMEMLEELLHLGKKVYLPKVIGEDMDFYRIRRLDDLEEGYKGIPEPKETCTDIFSVKDYENTDSTVMLMPGAVFALDGSRIGYGKGYYDRYLAKYDIMNRIALCFSFQIRENIPSDAHDKKASVIVTELGVTECRKV